MKIEHFKCFLCSCCRRDYNLKTAVKSHGVFSILLGLGLLAFGLSKVLAFYSTEYRTETEKQKRDNILLISMISISITFGMFLIISSIVLILKKEENISPVLRVICLILISSHFIMVDLPLSLLASFGILLNKRNLVKLYVILRMFVGIVSLVICSVIFVTSFSSSRRRAEPNLSWLLYLLAPITYIHITYFFILYVNTMNTRPNPTSQV